MALADIVSTPTMRNKGHFHFQAYIGELGKRKISLSSEHFLPQHRTIGLTAAPCLGWPGRRGLWVDSNLFYAHGIGNHTENELTQLKSYSLFQNKIFLECNATEKRVKKKIIV